VLHIIYKLKLTTLGATGSFFIKKTILALAKDLNTRNVSDIINIPISYDPTRLLFRMQAILRR